MTLPPRRSIWAAGGVVHRTTDAGPEVLLIHRERYDDWSLPKGKLEKNEDFLDCALREAHEETGYRVNSPRMIGTTGYVTPAGKPKVVRWWLLEAGEGRFKPNSEVDHIEWLAPDVAAKRATYEGDVQVIERGAELLERKRSGRIYLVRHAWAGNKTEWAKRDWQRPLDRNGMRQARRLALDLEIHPITRVITSHYKRCVDTVRPLAAMLGITLERDKRLGAQSDAATAIAAFRELNGESAVVSSHGEVIGDVITTLDAQGIPLDGPREWRKGSMWVLTTRKGKIKSGTYLPPA